MRYEMRSQGVTQHSGLNQNAARDAKFQVTYRQALAARRHMFQAILSFMVKPPLTEEILFDMENLVAGPAVGCYICEQPYRPGMENTNCKGGPER